MWTPSQRSTLILICAVLLAGLGLRLAWNRAQIDDPQPEQGARAGELLTKLDPNHADWAALATIPGVNQKQAKEIVAYREQFQRDHPNQRAFAKPEDLDNVKGIGPATVDAMRPYLIFP